tara:strand:+ start:2242 stop:2712 length:471 start_codon:yes stop_codon:yes gene_type:complete
MKLSELKNHLTGLKNISFQLPTGKLVPTHFHVTEVGKITKSFIDCGGKVRFEEMINFQLWTENDYEHRLRPEKLVYIIEQSEQAFKFKDLEIEVEFQGVETIGKYDLDFDGNRFLLISKTTACLAEDACGITTSRLKVEISNTQPINSCDPNSGCC